jgi:tetratricopeptide (TPR) repeat protein
MERNISNSKILLQLAVIVFGLLSSMTTCPLMAQGTGGSVDEIRGLINKGNYLLSKRQFQQAIDAYQRVLDLEPNNPYAKTNILLAHNDWGIFYFQNGNYESAKSEWDKALSIDANDRNARNNLVVLQRTLAKMGKSLEDISSTSSAKAEEKKAETAAPPPSAVLLIPKKRDGQKSADGRIGNNIASYTEDDLKVPPAKDLTNTTNPPNAPEQETVRSKEAEELDAFKRMTSSGGSSPLPASNPTAKTVVEPAPTNERAESPTSEVRNYPAESTAPAPSPEKVSVTAPEPASGFSTANNNEDKSSEERKPARKKKSSKRSENDAGASEMDSSAMGQSQSPDNIDLSLAKLETKIYGQPKPGPSVLKRLEQIEVDSFGKASIGSITERLAKLKKMYSLHD